MKWGRVAIGADYLSLTADRIYLFDVGAALGEALVVGSLVAYLDGGGTGSGQQVLRPVVMEAGNPDSLIVGDEAAIVDGQAAGWVHMTFDMPALLRAGTEPRLGFATGQASDLARLSVALGNVGVSQRFTSPYGAAPDIAGAATDVGALATLLAVGVAPWAPRPTVTEEDLSGLPVDVAQTIFAGAAATTLEAMVCGWHYSNESPPSPASAIVRTDGPLAVFTGERVRVTVDTVTGPASVIVRIEDEAPFDGITPQEDISIARDAFMRLGKLSAAALSARVEVLA